MSVSLNQAPEETKEAPPSDYPRAMYRHDGQYKAAASPDEQAELEQAGWSTSYVAPLKPQSAQGAVQASGWDPFAMLLREVLEEVLDARGLGKSRAERDQAPNLRQETMQWPLGKKQEARKNG